MAVPHCFDYYRFVVSSEIRKYESSNLVLIFKIVLAIWSPLRLHSDGDALNL